MGHGITERDGVFAVRDAGWHGLAKALPDYPTREEAQAIAHPWEPVPEPLYRLVEVQDPDCSYGQPVIGACTERHTVTRYEEVPDRAVIRSDNGLYLGAISPTLEIVRNETMYDIAEALEGGAKGSVKFETGGSLFEGRKVWLLLRLREPLKVAGGPVIPYFGLQNDNTGGGSFRGQATLTKIICDNTAQMADLDSAARGTSFTFRHTRKVSERIEEAKQALSGWRESIETYERFHAHLASLPVDSWQKRDFVERFIPDAPPHTVSERVTNNIKAARKQVLTILGGQTCEGIENTAAGLVQASIEYLNHHRKARSAETRFKRAYLDRDKLTADAVAIALDVAR